MTNTTLRASRSRIRVPRCWILALLISLITPASMAWAEVREAPESEGIAFFEARIRPVLVENCYECHSSQGDGAPKADLVLDTARGMLEGGQLGPAVVPGDPTASLILEALRYEGLSMPPSKRLPDRVADDFERWIAMGAPDPRGKLKASTDPAATEALDPVSSDHWAFKSPTIHPVPEVADPDWAHTPIDHFIVARRDDMGLEPAPEADRRTLARRLAFDLTGLPADPKLLETFLADQRPDAFDRLVDRLLASPRRGEHRARKWLDIARYAEDQAHIVGDNKSLFYPNAHLYRDWVIDAFNADMPYDAFVRQQLAADRIVPEDPESHVALGYLGLGPKYYGRGSLQVKADEWEDRIDVTTRGLMGLTVACARCHDHKYDPIPTEDFYALAGIFASTRMYNRPLNDEVETKKDGQAEKPEDSVHIVREGDPHDIPVFLRGDARRKGDMVSRRFLSVLRGEDDQPIQLGSEESSGREELAEAIVDAENPLTARVIVNRIWGEVFGRPIVATPSNFGSLGERPTHPELLDDLAVRFVADGWSIKRLERQLVRTATYRQASVVPAEMRKADPENLWLARMPRRRLSIEMYRDAILAVAGRLAPEIGGPSIDPADPEATRRTVYSRVSRLELHPMLARFDFPDPNAHSPRRVETTTPLQKLFLLNGDFLITQAEALAERSRDEAGEDREARADWLIANVLGRPAEPVEIELARAFLDTTAEPGCSDTEAQAAWSAYAQALLVINEMMFRD